MTLLGLPLKGTIDQFNKKLEQKGYYVSPFSKDLPVGQRGFKGRWGNRDITIYDPQVKYRNSEAPSFLEEYGDQMF